jgi:PTS system mannitol-specific IIA component
VRIVVGIAGVNDEHLGILSKIAIIFSDEGEAQKMLDATTVDELYQLLGEVNAD